MGRDAIERGEAGGPYAYVVPPDQWDPGEAVELVNVFRRSGVEVHRATRDFEAGGTRYPAGSYLLYTAQAFRPHLVNLMEPRMYPEREQYPGGPPETPYDLAGWTLPLQMGVTVERIERPFRATTEEVTELAELEPGQVSGSAGFAWAFGPRENAAHRAANRLLADGERVWLADGSFQAVSMQPAERESILLRTRWNATDSIQSLYLYQGRFRIRNTATGNALAIWLPAPSIFPQENPVPDRPSPRFRFGNRKARSDNDRMPPLRAR